LYQGKNHQVGLPGDEEDKMHTPSKTIEMNSISDVGNGRTMEQIRADYFEEKKGPGRGVAGQELIRLRQSQVLTESAISSIARSLARIADAVDPPPADKVDTSYVAQKLGIGLARVSQMASQGEIPASCIVAGTGHGKIWKFHRERIDEWIESR
jgi:helix-turn-helix protein